MINTQDTEKSSTQRQRQNQPSPSAFVIFVFYYIYLDISTCYCLIVLKVSTVCKNDMQCALEKVHLCVCMLIGKGSFTLDLFTSDHDLFRPTSLQYSTSNLLNVICETTNVAI